MNFTSSYKAFVNQISKVNGQGPCLASIFGQTLYYILVSNSNFYDFKISSELQSFTPYMNFPDSNYSYKNSQCLISLTRGGRLKLSPWSVIDPRFSSKYSWLYICYILCRNYFWVAPLDNRAKIKPIFQPKHNLFTLNYISTNSNDIIQSPNYVFNPVISLILGPMTEFNLTKFFKTNKRFLKWPYYGFSQQFLNNFFTSFKTKRYKSIVAEGFMGPCEIAYLSRKKHRILRRTTFKNRGTWFRKFRRNRKYRRRFFAPRTKPKPSERNLVNKKRNNNYYKRFIFTFWKQIFGFYLRIQSKFRQQSILRRRLKRLERKCRFLVHKFLRTQSFRPSEKKRVFRLVRGLVQLNQTINLYAKVKTSTLRSGHNWKSLFKYYKQYKFGLKIRFFQSIIRISNFLNFIDRYFNQLFKFPDSIEALGNSYQKFKKFIKYWVKLRCTRKHRKLIWLVRKVSGYNRKYKRKFGYRIKPWVTRALAISKNFNLIRGRIGIQSIYALSRIAYFRSTTVELKPSIFESIVYPVLIFNHRSWFHKCIHSTFSTLYNLNCNYWSLLITNFKFSKVRTGAVTEFNYRSNTNCVTLITAKRMYCPILCNSNTPSFFIFASSDFYFPSKIIKFQKFTTRFGIRPVRRMGMYNFIFSVGVRSSTPLP